MPNPACCFGRVSTAACRNLANLTPITVAGFTTGGTFSATPNGLSINSSTGVISNSSISGTYTIKYEVLADNNGNVCRAFGSSTSTLVIEPLIVAASTLNYSSSNTFCGIGGGIVAPVLITTYTYDGVASATVPTPNPNVTGIYTVSPVVVPGLVLNSVTGEIDFATSAPGTYIVKFTATGATPNCYTGNNPEVTIIITAPTLETVGFSYNSPVCKIDTTNPLPIKASGFVNGGTYSSTSGLDVNPNTGEINLLNSIPGNYIVNYLLGSNIATCSAGGFSQASITIDPENFPIFSSISACQGTTAPNLPSSFVNGATTITGFWTPATIDTTTTGTLIYTFNVNPGQCANNGTVSVTITSPNINPTFAPISVCKDTTAPSLPLNYFDVNSNTTINGSWTPATIDTTTTGTLIYTFNVNPGQCANNGTVSVTITSPSIVPTFTQKADICQGDALPVLTSNSNNTSGSISGTWSTTVTNTNTPGAIIYNFVPNPGQCALSASMTINVIANPIFTITGACQGGAYTLEITPAFSNATYLWYKGVTSLGVTTSTLIVTNIDTYSCAVTDQGCTTKQSISPTDIICSVQKGISPNGDGMNDEFDLSSFDVSKLEVYNRYGMLVYSKSGYKKEWFGQTDGGVLLPDGTYYYVINLNKGEAKTGWVYINKENN